MLESLLVALLLVSPGFTAVDAEVPIPEPCTCDRSITEPFNTCGAFVTVSWVPLGGGAGQCPTQECDKRPCEWKGQILIDNSPASPGPVDISAQSGGVTKNVNGVAPGTGAMFGVGVGMGGFPMISIDCGKTHSVLWIASAGGTPLCGGQIDFNCEACAVPPDQQEPGDG